MLLTLALMVGQPTGEYVVENKCPTVFVVESKCPAKAVVQGPVRPFSTLGTDARRAATYSTKSGVVAGPAFTTTGAQSTAQCGTTSFG